MKDLAKFYLRFWYQADNAWWPADNAPIELSRFIADLPASIDRQMVFQSLALIAAGNPPPDVLPTAEVIAWIAKHPAATRHCDATLKAGRAPKSYGELIQKAYLTEVREVRDRVQAFIRQQIQDFENR